MKMNIEHIITGCSLVAAIAGGIYFAEDRYTSNEVFEARALYADNYHLEKEIQRAQDKLEGLLLIPSNERRPWQVKEIIRLENLIARKIREKKA